MKRTRKPLAERHNSMKEMHAPWSESYGNATGRDAFYPGTHLPLRLEFMSLAGLSDSIYDIRTTDAVLPIVAPGYHRASRISESTL